MAHPATEALDTGLDVNEAAEGISDLDIFDDILDELDPNQAPDDEDQASPDDDEDGDETESQEDADDDQQDQDTELETTQSIQPPVTMSEEDRAFFNQASPELQNWMLKREADRDKGFQAKATELAASKRELAQAQRQITEDRLQFSTNLSDHLLQRLQNNQPNRELNNPNSPYYNPGLFNQQVQQYQNDHAQYQRVKHSEEQLKVQRAQQAETELKEMQAQRNETLTKDLPGWANPEYQKKLSDYAKSYKYTDELINEATAEDYIILSKAMKYDELMAAKPGKQDAVKKLPKYQKPGAKSSETVQSRKLNSAKNKFRKSGRVEDAAVVLEQFIDD